MLMWRKAARPPAPVMRRAAARFSWRRTCPLWVDPPWVAPWGWRRPGQIECWVPLTSSRDHQSQSANGIMCSTGCRDATTRCDGLWGFSRKRRRRLLIVRNPALSQAFPAPRWGWRLFLWPSAHHRLPCQWARLRASQRRPELSPSPRQAPRPIHRPQPQSGVFSEGHHHCRVGT